MKYGGGRLVHAVGLAERIILVNHGIEGAPLNERANLGHFRGGKNRGDNAINIPALLPLFLILEERLFHGLHFAKLGSGAWEAGSGPRERMHRSLAIAAA